MLNQTDYLLIKLAEECMEVAHECTKAVTFGLDDEWNDGPTPREKIQKELTDLRGVLKELEERHRIVFRYDDLAVTQKQLKIRRFMQYSRDRKKLTD